MSISRISHIPNVIVKHLNIFQTKSKHKRLFIVLVGTEMAMPSFDLNLSRLVFIFTLHLARFGRACVCMCYVFLNALQWLFRWFWQAFCMHMQKNQQTDLIWNKNKEKMCIVFVCNAFTIYKYQWIHLYAKHL